MASVQGRWAVEVTRNEYIENCEDQAFCWVSGLLWVLQAKQETDRQTDGQAERLLEDIGLRRYSG